MHSEEGNKKLKFLKNVLLLDHVENNNSLLANTRKERKNYPIVACGAQVIPANKQCDNFPIVVEVCGGLHSVDEHTCLAWHITGEVEEMGMDRDGCFVFLSKNM